MDSLIDGVTSTLVQKSLDMALIRHQVIANNISNVDTTGFKPMKVGFEETIQRLYQQFSKTENVEQLKSGLKGINLEAMIYEDESAEKVLLDREIANMAKNTLNYQALLTAQGKLGKLLKLAINGGRN